MLPQNSWKVEALVRLVIGVFACWFAGFVLTTILFVAEQRHPANWKFVLASSVALTGFGLTLVTLRKPWTPETSLPRLTLSLIFVYVGMAAAVWATSVIGKQPAAISIDQMLISFLTFQGAALLLIHVLLRQQQMKWSEAFGLANRVAIAILSGLIAGILFSFFGNAMLQWIKEAMKHLPIKPEEQPAVQTLRLASSWIDRLVLGGGTIVLVPFAEETLFRGILYSTLKRTGLPKLALLLTSLLFAAIHVNIATFIPLFLMALVLTFLYEITGNLLAPITMHAVFNAISFIEVYRQQAL